MERLTSTVGIISYLAYFFHGTGPTFIGSNRQTQDQAESVMIPWWDWSSDVSRSEGIPEAFADETINRRHSNPLYKAHINVPTTNPPLDLDTFRMPGRPSALPNYEDVNRVLSLSDFGDFNDELEDLHDRVHGWTGGTMGRVATGSF